MCDAPTVEVEAAHPLRDTHAAAVDGDTTNNESNGELDGDTDTADDADAQLWVRVNLAEIASDTSSLALHDCQQWVGGQTRQREDAVRAVWFTRPGTAGLSIVGQYIPVTISYKT